MRNLLKPFVASGEHYFVGDAKIIASPKTGETTTFKIFGKLGKGKTGFSIYNSGAKGEYSTSYLTDNKDGTYSIVCPMQEAGPNTPPDLRLYAFTSNTEALSEVDNLMMIYGDHADAESSVAPETYKSLIPESGGGTIKRVFSRAIRFLYKTCEVPSSVGTFSKKKGILIRYCSPLSKNQNPAQSCTADTRRRSMKLSALRLSGFTTKKQEKPQTSFRILQRRTGLKCRKEWTLKKPLFTSISCLTGHVSAMTGAIWDLMITLCQFCPKNIHTWGTFYQGVPSLSSQGVMA